MTCQDSDVKVQAVKFNELSVVLGGNQILENISASVPQGSCTAVVGPNGAGKTTLLLALLGELPYSGVIKFAEKADGKVVKNWVCTSKAKF